MSNSHRNTVQIRGVNLKLAWSQSWYCQVLQESAIFLNRHSYFRHTFVCTYVFNSTNLFFLINNLFQPYTRLAVLKKIINSSTTDSTITK